MVEDYLSKLMALTICVRDFMYLPVTGKTELILNQPIYIIPKVTLVDHRLKWIKICPDPYNYIFFRLRSIRVTQSVKIDL